MLSVADPTLGCGRSFLTYPQPASVFSLLYPSDPEIWKRDLGPVGKAAAYIGSGKTTALPSWVSAEEYAVRERIFSKGGYRGPLNWYKAAMRAVNTADEEMIGS